MNDDCCWEPLQKTGVRMKLLPRDQWTLGIEITPEGRLILLLGCRAKENYRHWQSIPFSDFSQNLTRLDDLERLVINMIDGQST